MGGPVSEAAACNKQGNGCSFPHSSASMQVIDAPLTLYAQEHNKENVGNLHVNRCFSADSNGNVFTCTTSLELHVDAGLENRPQCV